MHKIRQKGVPYLLQIVVGFRAYALTLTLHAACQLEQQGTSLRTVSYLDQTLFCAKLDIGEEGALCVLRCLIYLYFECLPRLTIGFLCLSSWRKFSTF